MIRDMNALGRLLKSIHESAGPEGEFKASTLCRVASRSAAIRNELEAAMGTWYLSPTGVGKYLTTVAGIMAGDLQIKRRILRGCSCYRVVDALNERALNDAV